MNTSTKRAVKKLVEFWFENPEEDYSVYYSMIESTLMDMNPTTETADFFKAVESELRNAMKESPSGRMRSYNDFVTALHDHKEMWL